MSALSDLQEAHTNLCTAIKDATANPKPNYTKDGQTVKWSDYLQDLLTARDAIARQIADEEGPYEEITSAYS